MLAVGSCTEINAHLSPPAYIQGRGGTMTPPATLQSSSNVSILDARIEGTRCPASPPLTDSNPPSVQGSPRSSVDKAYLFEPQLLNKLESLRKYVSSWDHRDYGDAENAEDEVGEEDGHSSRVAKSKTRGKEKEAKLKFPTAGRSNSTSPSPPWKRVSSSPTSKQLSSDSVNSLPSSSSSKVWAKSIITQTSTLTSKRTVRTSAPTFPSSKTYGSTSPSAPASVGHSSKPRFSKMKIEVEDEDEEDDQDAQTKRNTTANSRFSTFPRRLTQSEFQQPKNTFLTSKSQSFPSSKFRNGKSMESFNSRSLKQDQHRHRRTHSATSSPIGGAGSMGAGLTAGLADIGERIWGASRSGYPSQAFGSGGGSKGMMEYMFGGPTSRSEERSEVRSKRNSLPNFTSSFQTSRGRMESRESSDESLNGVGEEDRDVFGRPTYGFSNAFGSKDYPSSRKSTFPRAKMGRFGSSPSLFMSSSEAIKEVREAGRNGSWRGSGGGKRHSRNSSLGMDGGSNTLDFIPSRKRQHSSSTTASVPPSSSPPSVTNSNFTSSLSRYPFISLAIAKSSIHSITSVCFLICMAMMASFAILGLVVGSYGLTIWDDARKVWSGGKATKHGLLVGAVAEGIRRVGKTVEEMCGVTGVTATFYRSPSSASTSRRSSISLSRSTSVETDKGGEQFSIPTEEEWNRLSGNIKDHESAGADSKSTPNRPPLLILVPSVILALVIMIYRLVDTLVGVARNDGGKGKGKGKGRATGV